jgi:maleylpyruvate isomerase
MITLYDYWRSGTSHRTRIALHLKGLSFTHVTVDLRARQHKEPDFLARNPQGLVPALEVDGVFLNQSPAILEWLEETYPAPPLLPSAPIERAQVRAMAAVVACDIHPLGNMRVLVALGEDYGQPAEKVAGFALRWIEEGFAALDAMAARGPGGPWLWGDAPSLADCCVIPQIYAAQSRYGLDIAAYPRLAQAAAAAELHPAFVAAHPLNQPDSPR